MKQKKKIVRTENGLKEYGTYTEEWRRRQTGNRCETERNIAMTAETEAALSAVAMTVTIEREIHIYVFQRRHLWFLWRKMQPPPPPPPLSSGSDNVVLRHVLHEYRGFF